MSQDSGANHRLSQHVIRRRIEERRRRRSIAERTPTRVSIRLTPERRINETLGTCREKLIWSQGSNNAGRDDGTAPPPGKTSTLLAMTQQQRFPSRRESPSSPRQTEKAIAPLFLLSARDYDPEEGSTEELSSADSEDPPARRAEPDSNRHSVYTSLQEVLRNQNRMLAEMEAGREQMKRMEKDLDALKRSLGVPAEQPFATATESTGKKKKFRF